MFCQKHNVVYQPFWVLSANGQQLKSPAVTAAALAHRKSPEQVLFSYLRQQGAQPLSGTTSTGSVSGTISTSSCVAIAPPHRSCDAIARRRRARRALVQPRS